MYNRERYQANKEKAAATMQRYHAMHSEQHRAATQRWRAASPERVRELGRKYDAQRYAANPTAFVEKAAIHRARKAGATVERVYRSVVFSRDNGLCGECGTAVDPQNWHLDHVIPLARGGEHSYANTQITHPLCNLQKGAH